MSDTETLLEAALEVLNTADPIQKARLGEAAAKRWLQGEISVPYRQNEDLSIPNRPARLASVKLVAPSLMPKLGKGGSLQSRLAMLHSLVHTESWAIDLSWDIIARFGRKESMPRDFFTDFVKVAQDEGRHFVLLARRLEELGSFYGAFPAHDGLWDSANQTSNDLSARLAVEHCVHEARGLDVLPTTISRFRNGGDEDTANLLETVIYPEEITHCAAGVKWFTYLCQRKINGHQDANISSVCLSPENGAAKEHSKQQVVNRSDGLVGDLEQPMKSSAKVEGGKQNVVIEAFHDTVRRYFRGPLKPPFNVEARKAAGFGPDWYEPLASREVKFPVLHLRGELEEIFGKSLHIHHNFMGNPLIDHSEVTICYYCHHKLLLLCFKFGHVYHWHEKSLYSYYHQSLRLLFLYFFLCVALYFIKGNIK